ncbi:hypothetical protein R1T08_02420 [Streptomyces sp. SBC-4]|nr:hypothetical protein [Streptomyces sp. SBC-4]MDV5143192.1 hypothetical protein [Streptomyces sp. SBC-4]
MNPTFDDPSIMAVYRYLTGAAEPPRTGQRPTPANMPRRIQRPRSAADIARAEGLDLGDMTRRPRSERRSGPRPPRRSALRVVMDHLLEAGCPRQEAAELAGRWLQADPSAEGVRRWMDTIGAYRPDVALQLRLHNLGTDDLDVPVDGTPARRRLRDGEPIGQVIAALLTLRQPPA